MNYTEGCKIWHDVYDPRKLEWPVGNIALTSFSWRGHNRIPVANEDIAVIFYRVLDEIVDNPADNFDLNLDKDEWGYANRLVTNGAAPSFHAAGIAMDIEAQENPYVRDGSWRRHTIPDYAGQVARKYGCQWGGDWTKPKDYMHFEFHGVGWRCARLIADRIRQENGLPTPRPPEASAGNGTIQRGSTGELVRKLQGFINRYYRAGLVVDGIYGRKTEGWVKIFQQRSGLVVDGVVGPESWRRMGY